ncbi:hypothetical protein PMIN06_009824 [Paraphaeosphaeria minitans]
MAEFQSKQSRKQSGKQSRKQSGKQSRKQSGKQSTEPEFQSNQRSQSRTLSRPWAPSPTRAVKAEH